jgi:LysM repeat protein
MLLKQYEEVIKYKVTKGDTLTKIGLIYNINTKLIKSANPKLGDNLHPGDIILLPIKKMSQVGSTHLQQDSSIRSDDFVIKSGP